MEVVVVVDRVGGVEVWREGQGGRTGPGARVAESARERPGAGRGSELFGWGGDVGLAPLLAFGEERSGLGGGVFVLCQTSGSVWMLERRIERRYRKNTCREKTYSVRSIP